MTKPKFVGILNITPDSFSDGGKFCNATAALAHAENMLAWGVDVIDIGAESTRPGANIISQDEEWKRLEPILPRLQSLCKGKAIISLDTRNSETAAKAVKFDISWLNDVSGFASEKMLNLAKNNNVDVVIMHSLSIPADKKITMPEHIDVIKDIYNWAVDKIAFLTKAGIKKEKIIFDPGIGFGKTATQSLCLIQNAHEFARLGVRIMFGHSRKSFLANLTYSNIKEKDIETLSISNFLAEKKVDYLRIHNVEIHRRFFTTSYRLQ